MKSILELDAIKNASKIAAVYKLPYIIVSINRPKTSRYNSMSSLNSIFFVKKNIICIIIIVGCIHFAINSELNCFFLLKESKRFRFEALTYVYLVIGQLKINFVTDFLKW